MNVRIDIARLGEMLGVHGPSEILADSLRSRLSALDKKVSAISLENKLTVSRILDIDDGLFYVA